MTCHVRVLGDSLADVCRSHRVLVYLSLSALGLTLASVQSSGGQLFSISYTVAIPCSQSSHLHPVEMNLAVYQEFEKASFLSSHLYDYCVT